MKTFLLLMLVLPAAAPAQRTLTRVDSALIGRILLAEDRRDSIDQALVEGTRHRDERVRQLSRRALWRIRDSKFAARDSFPALQPPTPWPEPSWRLRYRALTAQRESCGALRAALADSVWPVRLRAAALLPASCASDAAIVATLQRWIDELPPNASRRARGEVSWHAAAHAAVALSRLRPDAARAGVAKLAAHRQWQPRMYAARAAAILRDSLMLRRLARDANDNVVEAAIDGLSRVTSHADDDLYIAVIRQRGPQAARAAALALKGTPRAGARSAAAAAFERWARRANASERDVRIALLAAAGRDSSEDRARPVRATLPPDAVALALGADVRLRVTMAPGSGGGSFAVRLRGDVAPMMAARILSLARSRFYDGLGWHRVEHDFVIQGLSHGDNEYVGLAQYLRDELGTVPHTRGTVGMSTRGHDTGDAQWFVNLKDNLRLGTDYTVFAEVVDGMDVADDVMEGDVVATIREERPAAWRALFDGRTTRGWRGYRRVAMPAGWRVVDGMLTKSVATRDIVTTEQFGDFELELEWKLEPGGNAGLFYRATEAHDYIFWSAPEYQLLDDAGAADGRSRFTAAGATHSIHPAPAGVVKPANQWNATRLVVRGAHVEHWLNGVKLHEYELWSSDWEARVKASKFGEWPNYGRARRGHIGIQGDHEGTLSLRNVRVRELR